MRLSAAASCRPALPRGTKAGPLCGPRWSRQGRAGQAGSRRTGPVGSRRSERGAAAGRARGRGSRAAPGRRAAAGPHGGPTLEEAASRYPHTARAGRSGPPAALPESGRRAPGDAPGDAPLTGDGLGRGDVVAGPGRRADRGPGSAQEASAVHEGGELDGGRGGPAAGPPGVHSPRFLLALASPPPPPCRSSHVCAITRNGQFLIARPLFAGSKREACVDSLWPAEALPARAARRLHTQRVSLLAAPASVLLPRAAGRGRWWWWWWGR